jgi:hypothetical protein
MSPHQTEHEAEAFIISCVSNGTIADFSDREGLPNEISGRFLRALMLGLPLEAHPKSCPLPAGLRMRGAIIRGPIDLRDCTNDGACLPPLALMDCRFEPEGTVSCDLLESDPVPSLDLSGAHITSLSLNGSRFGLMKASSCVVDGDVDVSNVAALRPDRASIFVEACCWMNFAGSRIAGMMFARDLDLHVPNWPQTPDFDRRQPRYALSLAAATIGGTLDLSGGQVRIDGGVSLYLAKIGGDLWLGGCELISNGGGALYAQGLCVRAVFAERLPPLKAKGMVSFSDARIEHGISLPGAIIIAATNGDDGKLGTAIRANGLTTGSDLSLKKIDCRGSIELDRARIGGTLSLEAAWLNGEGRDAIHAPGATIGGSLLLSFGKVRDNDEPRGFRADGCLWLYGASIGKHLDLRGASLKGSRPETDRADFGSQYVNALSATDLAVGDCIFLGDVENNDLRFEAEGAVRIQRARVAKHIEIACASIGWAMGSVRASPASRAPEDTALDLGWTRIEGSLKLEKNKIHGSINLSHTYAVVLSDSLDGYPSTHAGEDFGFEIDGFEYQTLLSPALLLSAEASSAANLSAGEVAKTRIDWLARSGRNGRKPHGYAILARALLRQALPDAAREVMMQQQRLDHPLKGLWRRPGALAANALMRMFGFAFGFGFSPRRATICLSLALALGTAFFWWANDRGAMVIDQQPVAIAIGRQKPVTIEFADNQTVFGARAASDIPCHRSITATLYALDVFIPLVDLREESKCDMGEASGAHLIWGEETVYRVFKSLYALAGWLIISLSILTYTGFIERRRIASS